MNMINTNTSSSSNQNSPRNSNDISHSLTQSNTASEKRHVSISRNGTNLVNALFHWDNGIIGNGILKYLSLRDIKALREVCTEMRSMLFQKGVFNLSITPDRLTNFDPVLYPRLYPRVQNSSSVTFEPVPADAFIQNVGDLQKILNYARFIVKGIVFTGKLWDLKEVCEALPSTINTLQITIDISESEKIDINRYRQLKVEVVKNHPDSNILPQGAIVFIDKLEDLIKLEEISCLIDEFSKLPSFSKEAVTIFAQIGSLASDLHYNDMREGNEECIRNKYGSIDRSKTDEKKRRRKEGLELIHLAALEKVAEKVDPHIATAALLEIRKDLDIIKTKISWIIEVEKNTSPKTAKERLEEYKQLDSTSNFKGFVNYFYAKEIVRELIEILQDNQLQHLNFTTREDRYYFGRVLSLVGELSKDLREFVNPGSEAGLFGFFKRIRDKKMAHTYSVMVLDIDEKEGKGLELLRTLLTVNFRNRLNTLKDCIENFGVTKTAASHEPANIWNDVKKVTLNLGKTTAEEKNGLNKLLEVIFDKSQNEVDEAVLLKVGTKDLSAEQEEKHSVEKEAVEQRAIVVRNAATSLENIIKKIIKINELGSKKKKGKQIAEISKETFALIKAYNKAVSNYDELKISNDAILPALEVLKDIQEKLKNSEAAIAIVEKQLKEKDLMAEAVNDEDEEDKVEDKKDTKAGEPKLQEKVRFKKQIEDRLSIVSKELAYIIRVINDQDIDSKKKNNVIEFGFTKVGQIFADIGKKEKKERELLEKLVPDDFSKSMEVTEKTRHKLMHDILARKKMESFSETLFRHTLPMLSEIESLREVLKYQTLEEATLSDGGLDSLFKLGMAYVDLKNYNKAIECFENMRKICKSKMILIDNNTLLENDINVLEGILNIQSGLAELYGKAGNDEIIKGNEIQAQKFYKYKIICLEQYIKLALEYPGIIQNQIASAYNNLANAYSDVGDFDKAVQGHKKAIELLKKLENKDDKREALYLANLGKTYTLERQRRINLALEKGTNNIPEALKTMQLAVACLWEARERYERAGITTENSEYVRVTSELIKALYYCAPDRRNALYAQELFRKLETIIQRFPARENSQEILMMNKLVEGMQLVSQLNYSQELVEKFKNDREIVDLEFELERLNHLKIFYADIGIQYELNDRLAILKEKLANCGPSELSLKARFHLEVGTLVNKSSELVRQNLPAKALEGYLIALQGLSSVEYKKFIPDVIGDLLESIGDTYSALGELAKALEYFMRSLEAHAEHGPNDRAFGIPGKIVSLNKEFFEDCLKALVILEKAYGNEHPNVAKSYANVGEVLRNQGNYTEALKFHRRALAITEKVYGNEHPNVAISYNYIGLSLSFQGKYSEALEYFLNSLAICEKTHGPEHSNTIKCRQNIKFLEQQISTQEKVIWREITWIHPHINAFINMAYTITAQGLLQIAGIDSNEVKMTVDTSRTGEMHLSLNFSSSSALKNFVKYCQKYNNLLLPHSQLEYNAGQPVEIFIDTKALQEIMPKLDRYRNSILQEKK